jgi:hypothetical protein
MKKKIFLFILILNILVPTVYSFYNAVLSNNSSENNFLMEILKNSEEESKEGEDADEKEKNFISIQIIVPSQDIDSRQNLYYSFDCKALTGNQQIFSPPPKN